MFEFSGHKINRFPGSIDEFLEKKRLDSLSQLEKKDKKIKNDTGNSSGKESYLEKKEFLKILRKTTRDLANCESEIEHLEDKIKKLTEIFHSPEKLADIKDDKDLFIEYEKLKQDLEGKTCSVGRPS